MFEGIRLQRGWLISHYGGVWWALRPFKLPTTWLFVTACSHLQQIKHRKSHYWSAGSPPVDSQHNGPVPWIVFPHHDVIMEHILSNSRVIHPSLCHSRLVILDAVADVWLAGAFQSTFLAFELLELLTFWWSLLSSLPLLFVHQSTLLKH